MTKIAATPIYGKKPLKSYSPETEGWWHWDLVLGSNQACSNDDHRLTLTYFMARSHLFSHAFKYE